MSKYTTGEIAKLCGVTVRTVQYYDTRNLLIPSEFSEGGRRLYSEEDLKRLKLICFLRDIGLPIDSIKQLFSEKNSEATIALLLKEREKELLTEIKANEEKLRLVNALQSGLKTIQHFTVDSIGDIAHIMENKSKLRKMRLNMLLVGFIMDTIEVATLMVWILKGIWQPFVFGMLVVIALGIWISCYYFRNTVYICPQCHTIFKPKLNEAFGARHTPNTRKLTCTHCEHHGFCVETYGKLP